MQYTKNIGIKLKLLGFEFSYGSKDEGIEYEVWEKGVLEVTVDHSCKDVTSEVNAYYVELNIKSLDQLMQLDNLINK